MALVQTLTTDPGQFRPWVSSGGYREGFLPNGKMVFGGTDRIPTKLAADDNQFVLTCPFPTNFAYRLIDFRVWTQSEQGNSSYLDFEPGMRLTMTSDEVGMRPYEVAMYNAFLDSGVTNEMIALGVPPANVGFTTWPPAGGIPSAPILATGSANLQVEWWDISSDATDQFMDVDWCIVVNQYNRSQFDAGAMHMALPVLGV